jgi:GxxExxY protein
MHTDAHGYEWEKIAEAVIGCAYKVANALGAGFLEKVYENALAHEIRKTGLMVAAQHPIAVIYDGIRVGDYSADLLVADQVLVELKACRATDDVHLAQCLNYLKATNRPVCLLINFGTPRIKIRRILNPEVPNAWVNAPDAVDEPIAATDSHLIRVHPCPSVVLPS